MRLECCGVSRDARLMQKLNECVESTLWLTCAQRLPSEACRGKHPQDLGTSSGSKNDKKAFASLEGSQDTMKTAKSSFTSLSELSSTCRSSINGATAFPMGSVSTPSNRTRRSERIEIVAFMAELLLASVALFSCFRRNELLRCSLTTCTNVRIVESSWQVSNRLGNETTWRPQVFFLSRNATNAKPLFDIFPSVMNLPTALFCHRNLYRIDDRNTTKRLPDVLYFTRLSPSTRSSFLILPERCRSVTSYV